MAAEDSKRILAGHRVRRTATGVTIDYGDWDTELELTVDDLRRLLAFAETGAEPELTAEEKAAAEKGRDFAAFPDSLILRPE